MEHHALISALTVPKLKERCRELGIPVGGKKADLIARIQGRLAGAQVALVPSTPTRTNKTAAKRKAPIKSTPYTSEKNPERKKFKPSDSDISEIPPNAAQFSPSRPTIDLTNITVAEHENDQANSGATAVNGSTVTKGDGRSAEADPSELLSETLKPQLQPPRVLVSEVSSSKVHSVSRTTAQLLPQNFRGPGFTVGFSNVGVLPLPSPQLRTIQRESNVLPGANVLLTPQSAVGNKQIESVSGSTKALLLQLDCVSTQAKAVLSPIRNQLGQESLNMSLSANSVAVRRNDGSSTLKVTTRRFKGLKLNMDGALSALGPIGHPKTVSNVSEAAGFMYSVKTIHHVNFQTTANRSTSTTFLPPVALNLPRKKDHEISPSIIRNPPRYSLRRQVEKIAQILALTAFHGFSPDANSLVPGDFLKHFSGLSRNFRYASTLAFTHLIRIEFPGKRTDRWFKVKRVDEKVADVRPWYWYRVSGRARVIERVRTSWIERVWRFLVLASQPSTKSPRIDANPGRYELWFSGVNEHLLADPDLDGQCETAIRFWIRRFYVWVTKNGGGYPRLLHDLREEMVQSVQPLNEGNNQELWRLETRCGGVHYIVGMTGEVVGWVEANGVVSSGLGPVRQRKAKTGISTMIRNRTAVRTIDGESAARGDGRKQGNMNDVTWRDLRGDWREHASELASSTSPPGIGFPPKRLLETVYRPDSKTVSHGIHESVKLPRHRVLAERWILAQVEPGGISGKPILDLPSGRTHRKEKISLDLQAKLTVESVRCSGERWISSMSGVLAQGLGFVQTPGMGWFVLEETGQNIAQEDYGIQGLWATVLGVDENGATLSAKELEALAEMFVWKDTLD